MSLLTTYDNDNKVTSTALSVTYRQQFNGSIWEITRVAKKSYSFIGMDFETAAECAAAKRAQYTRSFSRIDSSARNPLNPALPAVQNVIMCPSDIAPQHREGGIWSVEIAVNEEDVLPSLEPVADPAVLFVGANSRNYDEDAGLAILSLDSAERDEDELAFEYTTAIADFNPDALALQYKLSESSTVWITAPRVPSVLPDTEPPPSPVTVPEDIALFVRLLYGSFASNVLTIPATSP